MKSGVLFFGLLLTGINFSYALDCIDAEHIDNEFYRIEKDEEGSWLFQAYSKELNGSSCNSRWGCDYEEVVFFEEVIKSYSDEDYGYVTWKGKTVTVRYEPEAGYFLKWGNDSYTQLECE